MPDVDDASEAAQEQRLRNIEELVRLRGLKKDASLGKTHYNAHILSGGDKTIMRVWNSLLAMPMALLNF